MPKWMPTIDRNQSPKRSDIIFKILERFGWIRNLDGLGKTKKKADRNSDNKLSFEARWSFACYLGTGLAECADAAEVFGVCQFSSSDFARFIPGRQSAGAHSAGPGESVAKGWRRFVVSSFVVRQLLPNSTKHDTHIHEK